MTAKEKLQSNIDEMADLVLKMIKINSLLRDSTYIENTVNLTNNLELATIKYDELKKKSRSLFDAYFIEEQTNNLPIEIKYRRLYNEFYRY